VRKVMLFAPMIWLVLLCACGMNSEDRAKEICKAYQTVSAAEMEADLLCHYGGEARSYSISCVYTPERSEVAVTAPEELAGIAAVYDGEQVLLSYEDMLLDAGNLSGSDISPLWALSAVMRAVREGYPLEYCYELCSDKDCLRITYEVTTENGEKQFFAVWFDEAALPVYGEIILEEQVVCSINWTAFSVQMTKEDGLTGEQDNGTIIEENMG